MLDGDDSKVYELVNHFVLYKLDVGDGKYWLFDIQEGSVFKLNEPSHFVLSSFDGENSLREVCQRFRNRYPNEDEKTLLDHFAEFCNVLIARGVLVESQGGGEA